MRRRIISITLGLLFSLTFFITFFSLTVLSKNFVKMVARQENYYETIMMMTFKEFENANISIDELSVNTIERDFNKYVKSKFKNDYIVFGQEKEARDIYNRNIKFNDFFQDYDVTMIIHFIYLFDIILIIITGMFFLKTKNKHDLGIIIIINFIVSILLFGSIKVGISIDNYFINRVIDKFNHYYLASSIVIFELMIVYRLRNRIRK